MMKTDPRGPLALIAALLAAPAFADPYAVFAAVEADAEQRLAHARDAADLRLDLSHAPTAFGSERVVRGAPFCADTVHEAVQPLVDAGGQAANRIVRSTSGRLCRDGEGRTRQEVERDGRRLVYLHDPVARERWVLDAQRKTARRSHGGAVALGPGDAGAWREFGERMREWAQEFKRELHREPPRPATPAARGASAAAMPGDAELVVIARQAREAAAQAGRQVETHMLRIAPLIESAMGAFSDIPAPPTPVGWTALQFAPRGEGVVTPLAGRDVAGLKAHGERTTWTIEAGKIGNERPIEIVREVWTVPELVLTVQVREVDPRRGETNYRLVNLKRGEPDAALMKVPADYSRVSSLRAPRPASAPPG